MVMVPNTRQTLEHLKQIKDEVKELHPILSTLFKKMDGVTKVDYNHGANELGADFILHKFDSTLQKTIYIGVVAKVGQIKIDHADVTRQVEECLIERKSSDGKDRIQIREVWVVSTGDLTNNAKEKIFDKFAKTRIEFIYGQYLAQLLDRYVPDQFITIPPHIQRYADEALQQISTEGGGGMVVPGGIDFYIEPDIVRLEYDRSGYVISSKSIGGMNGLCSIIFKSPFILIEGAMGVGKSKLAREIMRNVLQGEDFQNSGVFPYLIHCSSFEKNYQLKLPGLITDIVVKNKLSSTTRVIIIIDGFDEIDIPERSQEEVLSGILANVAKNSDVAVVLLTRPINEAGLLGAKVQSLDIFRVKPLRGKRAIDFLSKVGGGLDISGRIIKDIEKSRLFKALEGTPIAFILLGRLIAENHQDVPSNLTELFQKYMELVLGRWEIAKGLRSQVEYEVAVEGLTWLGDYMMTNKLTVLGRSELRVFVDDYVRERGLGVDAEGLISKLSARSGVLFYKESEDTISFRHRSFCEFFYARRLAKLSDVEIDEAVFHPYWANSYFFLAGTLRDCPDLISSLTNISLTDDGGRLSRAVHFGNFMLAGYLTPKRFIKDALLKVFDDISRLYVSICNREVDSPLSSFPVMQLLCVFATIIKSQYGYKHFSENLEECIYELEEKGYSESRAIALFLFDCAYKESGGKLRFDELIEKHGESLPTPLKLAIVSESKKMKILTDGVKRMERNLRRGISAHKLSARDFLKEIFDTPISSLPAGKKIFNAP